MTLNISGVNDAVSETGAVADEVLGAASHFSTQSEQIAFEVNSFVPG